MGAGQEQPGWGHTLVIWLGAHLQLTLEVLEVVRAPATISAFLVLLKEH